jgi:hypothetical protein
MPQRMSGTHSCQPILQVQTGPCGAKGWGVEVWARVCVTKPLSPGELERLDWLVIRTPALRESHTHSSGSPKGQGALKKKTRRTPACIWLAFEEPTNPKIFLLGFFFSAFLGVSR